MARADHPAGLEDALRFPLVEALLGRRSRRFLMGARVADGPFAYTSRKDPAPLSETERMLVLTAMAGRTGWHYLIPYNAAYAPDLPNYAGSAGGRTFPSAAGYHTSQLFFTDDDGVYFFDTRDPDPEDGLPRGLEALAAAHRSQVRKLSSGRLHLPAREPHLEGHNHWVVNRPGSLFVMPAADVAHHQIASLCYYLQNGYCIYDDVHRERIPGIERFADLCDVENPLPLTFVESYSLMECTTELSTACYAGALMLQALGLGGWMFNGVNPHSLMGVSGDPEVPGLGFRADTDERWALPNPTGLPGVFEGFCPPHYPDMRAAVDAFAARKFGPGGPFHPDTPGPWKASRKVRGSARAHDDRFRECVALQAEYTRRRFGRFPGTVPSILMFIYLQAHHLDLEFYDRHYAAGAYLRSHARHMARWHPSGAPSGLMPAGPVEEELVPAGAGESAD